MDPWAWIAVYVVGFALLQVVLYRYLGDGIRGTESLPPGNGDGGTIQAPSRPVTDADEIACGTCGAVNARVQGYRFCRECCQPLQ